MNRRILNVCALIVAVLFFCSISRAQFVQSALAAQHHGGGGGGGAKTFVNTTVGSNAASATSLALTAFSLTSGNAAVVDCRNGDTAGTITITATDLAGNTWNPVGSRQTSATIGSNEMFVALNVTGNASDVITCHFSSAVAFNMAVAFQFTGFALTGAIDQTSGTVSSGPTAISPSFTTTTAIEAVVCVATTANVSINNSGFTIGGVTASNFTPADGSGSQVGIELITSTAQSGITCNMPLASSTNYIIQVGSFR